MHACIGVRPGCALCSGVGPGTHVDVSGSARVFSAACARIARIKTSSCANSFESWHWVESIATAVLSEDLLQALSDFILLLYTSPQVTPCTGDSRTERQSVEIDREYVYARAHTHRHTHTHTQTHTSKKFGLSLRFHAHYCVLAQNISEGISKRKKAEASTRSHVICIGGRPAEQKDSRVRGEAGRRRRRV